MRTQKDYIISLPAAFYKPNYSSSSCVWLWSKLRHQANKIKLILLVLVLMYLLMVISFWTTHPLASPVVSTDQSSLIVTDKMVPDENDKLQEQTGEKEMEQDPTQNDTGTKPLSDIKNSNERREYVKQMMIWAWNGYAKHAWGYQELRPVSKTPYQNALFGGGKLGLTIIDAMDTLHMMGLRDQFEAGKKWISENFEKKHFPVHISVFEWNIRYVGGLLSCFALTGDKMFVQKAVEAADVLLPAFETASGIPYGEVDGQTGKAHATGPDQTAVLAELGSLHLEFEYLSYVTGNKTYFRKVQKIRDILEAMPKQDGLYPSYIYAHDPNTSVSNSLVSLGALSDSFYEYLLKAWLITKKQDVRAKKMYDDSIMAIERHLIQTSSTGLTYIGTVRLAGNRIEPANKRMDCFSCFAGGMFMLQGANEGNLTLRRHYFELGEAIGDTCHVAYQKTATGLGPETMMFEGGENDAFGFSSKYHQRPEALETWFYLWRTTKAQRYREWAWDLVMALEKYCKTEAGYSGLTQVYDPNPKKDDIMQSFFLAETLKYLYLIFSPDDFFSLDQWIFTTEAHPFPVHDHLV